MKSVVLDLVDEKGQAVMKVPIEEYGVPAPGESAEELDNHALVARAEDLISTVLRRVEELKAELTETPVRVRITISEALLMAAESEATEIAIVLKVRPRHDA